MQGLVLPPPPTPRPFGVSKLEASQPGVQGDAVRRFRPPRGAPPSHLPQVLGAKPSALCSQGSLGAVQFWAPGQGPGGQRWEAAGPRLARGQLWTGGRGLGERGIRAAVPAACGGRASRAAGGRAGTEWELFVLFGRRFVFLMIEKTIPKTTASERIACSRGSPEARPWPAASRGPRAASLAFLEEQARRVLDPWGAEGLGGWGGPQLERSFWKLLSRYKCRDAEVSRAHAPRGRCPCSGAVRAQRPPPNKPPPPWVIPPAGLVASGAGQVSWRLLAAHSDAFGAI